MFDSSDRTFAAAPVPDSLWLYRAAATFPYEEDYHGGYAFRFFHERAPGDTVFLPDEGCYVTTANNRLRPDSYPVWAMNPASEAWRSYYTDYALTAIGWGYDGIFGDNAHTCLRKWHVDALPKGYDADTYYEGMWGMLEAVKSALGEAELHVNGLRNRKAADFLDVVDGITNEGFGYSAWSTFRTGTYWANAFNACIVAEQEHEGKAVWILPQAPADSLDARLYALASFLLMRGDDSMYANTDSYEIGLHYFPEQQLVMGAAVADLDTIPPETNYSEPIVREFENGWAAVNPSTSGDTLVFDPPGSLAYRLRIDNLQLVYGGRFWTEPADEVAGDSLYTAMDTTPLPWGYAGGVRELDYFAQGDDGVASYGSFFVRVLPPSDGNLLTNPSFEWGDESGPDGWSLHPAAHASWVEGVAHHGERSVYLDSDGDFFGGVASQTVPGAGLEGTEIRVAARALPDGVTGGRDPGFGLLVRGSIEGGGAWFDNIYLGDASTGVTDDSNVPSPTTFGAARPNPFGRTTTISFDVRAPAPTRISLAVYDVAGRRVRTLLEGTVLPGTHDVTWDGRDERAHPVASGVYFCRLEQGGAVRSSKIVLLR